MTSDKELQSLQSADDLLECASCLQALGASVTVMGEKLEDSHYGEDLTLLGFMIISQAISLKTALDENSLPSLRPYRLKAFGMRRITGSS